MSLLRLAIALVIAACASAQRPQPAAVPESLRVPDGQVLLLRAAARGAQIYTCKVTTAEPPAFEWALKAPDAELFDQGGARSAGTTPAPLGRAPTVVGSSARSCSARR